MQALLVQRAGWAPASLVFGPWIFVEIHLLGFPPCPYDPDVNWALDETISRGDSQMALRYAGRPDRPPMHHHDTYSDRNASKRDRDMFDLDHDHCDRDSYHEPRRRHHQSKRARQENFACELPFLAKSDPEFVVLRENGVPVQETAAAAAAAVVVDDAVEKEQTASGLSIRSEPRPTERCASTELLEDEEAAQRVREHLASFGRRFPDSKHARILRSILQPRGGGGGGGGASEAQAQLRHQLHYPLDDDALASLFSAANEVFFNGRLSQRVAWDWSHASSARYDARVIGTTALRRAARRRGFETLIVLSGPILRDRRYSRRLLLSTFLHELIHCYMFVCCGFRARHGGGHTPGFRAIARIVDDWVGAECGLHLGNMEADLDLFLEPRCRRRGGEDQGEEADCDHGGDEDAWRPSPSCSPRRPGRASEYGSAQASCHDRGGLRQHRFDLDPGWGHVHEQQDHHHGNSLAPAGPMWRDTRPVHTPPPPGRPTGYGDYCSATRYP